MPGSSLTKLTITAYSDAGFSSQWEDPSNPMTVPINPSSYSQKSGLLFNRLDAAGGTGQATTYDRELGMTLQLDLVFDGTGAVAGASRKTVDQQICELKRLGLRINSSTHSPNFLKLSWGSLLFKCRLKSLGISYTLFNPDGTPLRARVAATFLKYQEAREGQADQNLCSPDLTHAVTVAPGDTLPLMCYRIYGESGYYAQVAEVNGLGSVRDLPVGAVLSFPPLAASA